MIIIHSSLTPDLKTVQYQPVCMQQHSPALIFNVKRGEEQLQGQTLTERAQGFQFISVVILLRLKCATPYFWVEWLLLLVIIKHGMKLSMSVLVKGQRFFKKVPDFSSSSRLASPFSLPWTFGLALKNMGGICFKIDILMLNFYCHGFCSCAFQILHLFVSELWMYRKNVTIVAEH